MYMVDVDVVDQVLYVVLLEDVVDQVVVFVQVQFIVMVGDDIGSVLVVMLEDGECVIQCLIDV